VSWKEDSEDMMNIG